MPQCSGQKATFADFPAAGKEGPGLASSGLREMTFGHLLLRSPAVSVSLRFGRPAPEDGLRGTREVEGP
jgi:hypothetical protein